MPLDFFLNVQEALTSMTMSSQACLELVHITPYMYSDPAGTIHNWVLLGSHIEHHICMPE